MKKVIATVGLPGSGKSTWAKEQGINRVSKDDLRAMIHNGKWSRENEKFILKIRDLIVEQALRDGQSIIIDDTNLAPKHVETLQRIAERFRADFEVKDFTDVPLEECIRRDKKRPNYVGEDVIRKMYNDYLRPEYKPVDPDMRLPWAILVDIDGTIAKMHNRGPFEWHKVGNDLPRTHVIDAVLGLASTDNSRIIFLSGRDAVCREDTVLWLNKYLGMMPGVNCDLYMRPMGDNRKDTDVKREIYENNILGKYNVRAVFDDRHQVCQGTWYKVGLADRLFRVGIVGEDDF